jgi:hypothetical protein
MGRHPGLRLPTHHERAGEGLVEGYNVIFDGVDYRVLWWESQGRMGYPSGLQGVRVTTEGRLAAGSRNDFGGTGRHECQDTPCDVANYLAWLGPELLLQPIGPGLQRKADAACASFQAGDAQGTRSHLTALLKEVRAQSGKKLSTSVADTVAGSITGLLND